MKKLIVIILFLIQYSAFAQLENSLLWQISGNGLEKPSYLYGTVHQICYSNLLVKPQLEKIIKSSEKVYLEIVFDEELNNFKSHYDLYLKNGKTLRSYYTTDQYQILEQKFNKKMAYKKVQLSYYSNFKPSEILRFIIPNTMPCPKWTSYEKEISKIAKKNKISTGGLETYEEHNSFETESDSTIKANAERLYTLITNKQTLTDYTNEFIRLTNLYQEGKINELYENSISEGTKKENELVLDFRNKLWIPRISQYSQKGQMLYAFGAAHLAGENGVINLLRKEGFTVTPVFE
ncbi:MAG TPA: TraB/GumN family protein [Leadbetterella sp.]|nr:TraB/GumN family protein [Leadbetterella sp.]